MNCREAQQQIFAERDGALENTQRATLENHVAQCAECRQVRDSLAAAIDVWRTTSQQVRVPDADKEWYAIRRRIRGGVDAESTVSSRRRSPFLTWFTVPLGAAAALAMALYLAPASRPGGSLSASSVTQIARADFVEAPGENTSTMVMVDEKSGWLFMVATDADAPKQG